MNCSDIKMNQFIYCLLTGDYKAVGGPDQWEELYTEFISLREHKSASYVLGLLKEIIHLKAKVFIIIECVQVLSKRYSQEVIAELKQTGVRGKFNLLDPVGYNQDLSGALTYSKRYTLQYQAKEKEIESYQNKYSGEVQSRKDFEVWAITLGKFMGYRVDLDQITAAEYCHMLNAYDRYCEVENSKTNKVWEKQ
jgi:hypothetical protein